MKNLGTATVEFYDKGCRKVVYRETVIYSESDNSIELNNGGYVTVTTSRKINQALIRNGHDQYKTRIRKGIMQVVFRDSVIGEMNNSFTISKASKASDADFIKAALETGKLIFDLE